ncbi:MAG: ABC transporter substrate-binding protein [Saccharofermentanales bacterium]
MKRKIISKVIALSLCIFTLLSLVACGAKDGKKDLDTPVKDGEEADKADIKSDDSKDTEGKKYKLRVSGIDASLTYFPVYLAQEKGWFEEVGLEIERSGFTNGPVQVEAIDNWDIGVTGVGGVLAGTISYDAVILGMVHPDDGTQALFVKPDSDVAKAGKGHNKINDEIIGDAESWKGMSINCTYGNVLHYMLLKTLSGFGLTADDVVINWMDMPTANTAFLSGEGDATCTSGFNSFADDKADFVMASTGSLAETGLMTNIVANPKSLEDPELREAMKIFVEVFYKATDWINANQDEAAKSLVEWSVYSGVDITEEIAKIHMDSDPFYSLEETYQYLHDPASDGGDYSKLQEEILGVLKFFIETESYQEGDQEKFLKPEHVDTSIIDELYTEKNK